MKRHFMFTGIFLAFFHGNILGQSSLTLNTFIDQILNHHPKVTQIELYNEMADANLLKAKGGFDPVLEIDWNAKDINNKEYYNLIDGQLKIPTRFGIDIKTGYERSSGLFLNPENSTPMGGLFFAGFDIPLGQSLLIDQRRANLWKSRFDIRIAEQSVRAEQNELIIKAIEDYLHWMQTEETRIVLQNILDNISQRFEVVKSLVLQGDRPGMDTTETRIQKQLVELTFRQVEMERQNAKVKLDAYFWNQGVCIGLPANAQPQANIIKDTNRIIRLGKETFFQNHPVLQQYVFKSQKLEIERRLWKDRLKPNLVFSFNPLLESTSSGSISPFLFENRKWGLTFYMPLLLRKERGEFRLAKANVQSLDLAYQNDSESRYAIYQTYLTTYNTLGDLVALYDETVKGYEQMYLAEKRLFETGESSLFLVNMREQTFMQAQLKKIEYEVKWQIAYYTILYTQGNLVEFFR